ncbi:putative RTA1 domain protein [Aureobasidium pullulans]|uniref:Putative RTA1 domain protein n=1 Tax=Aureobasidium pullulans TaxID=5580 RepID=A0A4S8VGJ5_AURPU|nr:putative RTA1 domain protein [Aureobasidium pullulans]
MSNITVVTRGLAPFDLFPYNPSATAAWTFLVLFAIVGVVHIVYMFILRAWFAMPLILGCVGEAFGYYGRAQSHDNIRNGGMYLIQLMLLLAAPPFLAATIYMSLGRIIRSLEGERHAMIRVTWLTKTYVVVDIACFVCQMAGSAMQSSGDPAGTKLGINIVLGGLGFQIFAFVIFVLMACRFHYRLNREPTWISREPSIRWRRCMWVLYATSLLVLVRNFYRIIEFGAGSDSAVYKSEVYLYVLDGSLMWLLVLFLIIVHPGALFRTARRLKKLGGMSSEEDEEAISLTDRK